jgi:hypothetical protein
MPGRTCDSFITCQEIGTQSSLTASNAAPKPSKSDFLSVPISYLMLPETEKQPVDFAALASNTNSFFRYRRVDQLFEGNLE